MKKLTQNEIISKFNHTHNYEYDYSLVNYVNTRTKVNIICKKHGIFEQTPKAHLNGQGCKKCNKYIPTNEEFKEKIKNIYGDKLDTSLVDYKNIRTVVTLICKEHGEFEILPRHLIYENHQGCYKCENKRIFLEKIKKVHGDTYNYDLTRYENAHQEISIICKKHGEFKQLAYHHTNNSGCPKCNESKGEKKIRNYLIENNIKFESQKKFEGCKNVNLLKYDFYLIDYNLCIEYDGEQHFMLKEYWGGEKGFEEVKKRDKIKTQYCKEHNINLLRIKYTDNIIDKLKEIFK